MAEKDFDIDGDGRHERHGKTDSTVKTVLVSLGGALLLILGTIVGMAALAVATLYVMCMVN